MGIFGKIKEKIQGGYSDYPDEFKEDYVEIDTKKNIGPKSKIVIRPFIIRDFPLKLRDHFRPFGPGADE